MAGRTLRYASGTSVRLTATPRSGSRFKEWRERLHRHQLVLHRQDEREQGGAGGFVRTTATSYRLTVTDAGDGSSQAGLAPAIACSLNGGAPSGTCSASYPPGELPPGIHAPPGRMRR